MTTQQPARFGLPGISDLQVQHVGKIRYRDPMSDGSAIRCLADFPRFLIRRAWHAGVNFEDLADGFGPGLGTMGGDWSGIRDSSDAAIAAMLERAINRMSFS